MEQNKQSQLRHRARNGAYRESKAHAELQKKTTSRLWMRGDDDGGGVVMVAELLWQRARRSAERCDGRRIWWSRGRPELMEVRWRERGATGFDGSDGAARVWGRRLLWWGWLLVVTAGCLGLGRRVGDDDDGAVRWCWGDWCGTLVVGDDGAVAMAVRGRGGDVDVGDGCDGDDGGAGWCCCGWGGGRGGDVDVGDGCGGGSDGELWREREMRLVVRWG
ncbi:hypothetical protein F0562_014752 [Nyssa sinensis]|uniref:Uncharacterized protein n=1 Tax=Nyssa sinensis TaxID=561372 RepID=A0A5J4ZRW5_9ASTE|nr:hypothetical protein F0562_014752 [Nyssa sinensis]